MIAPAGAAFLALFWAGAALACDYPGPAPGQTEARAPGDGVIWAGYSNATDRYPHGALGDGWEAGGLRAMSATAGPCELAVILPEDTVFEDVGPRIADIDGDGLNDIVVVESRYGEGASLAVYGVAAGELRKIAATPPIGSTNRWLAPVGIADLDGDGHLDIAYVETPHLGKTLRIWTWRDGGLVEIARSAGLTNHRFGEDFISGGVRDCGAGPELIVATADWREIVSVAYGDGGWSRRPLGRNRGPGSFAAALACQPL